MGRKIWGAVIEIPIIIGSVLFAAWTAFTAPTVKPGGEKEAPLTLLGDLFTKRIALWKAGVPLR